MRKLYQNKSLTQSNKTVQQIQQKSRKSFFISRLNGLGRFYFMTAFRQKHL